jgi:DNA 3'-phosphatase
MATTFTLEQPSQKKLYFFDLDDTLIKTHSGNTFPIDVWDMEFKWDVWGALKHILSQNKFPNIAVEIVTNQAGIGQYVEGADLAKKLNYIQSALHTFLDKRVWVDWQCCSQKASHPFRKPETGMLQKAYDYHAARECHSPFTKESCIMIGDASGKPGDFSDSDKKCAENFGIDYMDVDYLIAYFRTYLP